MLSSSFVQWIKPKGQNQPGRSVIVNADVDQSHEYRHQKRVEADIGAVNEPNNVHFTQQGKDLNVSVERKKKNSMQKEKGKAKVKQHGLDQHRDLSVLINGTRAFCKETGKLEDFMSEDMSSCRREDLVKETPLVNTHNEPLESNEPEVDLGPKVMGPSESVTKVYVRRKVMMASRGQAQFQKSPTMNPATSLQPDDIPSDPEEEVEKQLALLKDLGVTHGSDVSKVQQLLEDMDNRVNTKAAEMGIKNQQL